MKNVIGTNLQPKGNFPTPKNLGWGARPGRQATPQIPWGNLKMGKVSMPKTKTSMNSKLKRSLAKKGFSKNFS